MFRICCKDLDLEDAIIVLNHFKHEGYNDWYIRGERAESRRGDYYLLLSEFVAVAVAEKYLRDYPINCRLLSSDSTQSDSDANVSAIWQMKIVT